jgi:hypothetical protein
VVGQQLFVALSAVAAAMQKSVGPELSQGSEFKEVCKSAPPRPSKGSLPFMRQKKVLCVELNNCNYRFDLFNVSLTRSGPMIGATLSPLAIYAAE